MYIENVAEDSLTLVVSRRGKKKQEINLVVAAYGYTKDDESY
jgi:hypothetical protein